MLRGRTFESQVPYQLFFMCNFNIHCTDWLTLPAGEYTLHAPGLSPLILLNAR
jgi:hypothetical protein